MWLSGLDCDGGKFELPAEESIISMWKSPWGFRSSTKMKKGLRYMVHRDYGRVSHFELRGRTA